MTHEIQNQLTQISDLGLRTKVFEELARAIFRGRIAPGDRLIVQKIGGQLKVSATPVREALVELHELGLVELIPNRGAVCLPFGARQLAEMYLVRRVLEAEATRLASPHLSKDRLKVMRGRLVQLLNEDDINSPRWSADAIEVDLQLHNEIAIACGVGRLAHEINRYSDMMRIIRQVLKNWGDVQQIAIEEHITIIDAILADDPDLAASRMSAHIDHTASKVIESFNKDRTQAAAQ